MKQTLDALKALYVALGGSSATVANMTLSADVINAIATQAATVVAAANAKELPTAPTTNGTYNLQGVKSNSGLALSWASAG